MKLRAGFIIETDLGHATYAQNLRAAISERSDVDAEWADIPFGMNRWQRTLPFYSTNWTIRAGLRTRAAFQRFTRTDVLFIHTQVLAVLCQDLMLQKPTVISLDATPLQYDDLGDAFGHRRSNFYLEKAKWRLHRSTFVRARHIVTWSDAARESVVRDYDISHSKVSVIRPGIDFRNWGPRECIENRNPAKILFVGGDFHRKGGPLLVEVFRSLRAFNAELHIVTESDIDFSGPNTFVHKGMLPNSPELMQLFRNCDIFALATNGDFYPQVLTEASAMGLPIVTTDTGAISEIVKQDTTGLVIPRGDAGALREALTRLLSDYELRTRLGSQARAFVETTHDLNVNTARLLSILKSAAEPQPAG